MVGVQLNVLAHAKRIEPFNALDNSNMEDTPPFLQEAPVSHFVGERMLECILDLRKETCLIQKFRCLKPNEATAISASD